jgi:PAS domain S-box-containing protein
MKSTGAPSRAVDVAYFDARWQSPETLLAIFDQISDAVFFFDKNLLLVSVNPSGEKLFGLSAGDMLGKPSWALFHVAASEQDPNYSAHIPTGTLTLFDNGRQHRVLIRNIELLDEAGRLEGVVAIVTDLTERALEHDLDLNGHSGTRKLFQKYHPIVIRNRRVAAALGGLLLLLVLVPIAGIYFSTGKQLSPEERRLATAEKEKREASARFNAMTPAQHLERAKLALRPGAKSEAIQDALRHLKVIPPSSPEAARAKNLQKDLTKAGNLAQVQGLIDAASNADVRQGMEKLQQANAILDTVRGQFPNDSGASELSRQAQAAAEQLAMRDPHEFAAAETKLVDFTWEKGGFGTVMIANFTVRNDSPVDVGDLKIQCQHFASTGVVLDQNSGTAFALVKAHATTRIPNVNMGFLNAESGNSRTTKTDCEILGLKLASESEALRSTR